MEKKDRCRLEFTKTSAKITKTTIVEAVKMIQGCPNLFKLKRPAREVIEYIYDNIFVRREDKDGAKVARFYLPDPNPEFSKHNYSFGIKETPNGRMFIDSAQLYKGEQDLIFAVMHFIVYVPEFVEDCRERIDVFI